MPKSSEPVEPRIGICVCGQKFPIPSKRGRPPVRCEMCREAYANGTLRDRLGSLGIDPDRALRRRINSSPTSTPRQVEIGAETLTQIEKPGRSLSVSERVDRLEMLLKSRKTHISQHRDKW